METKAFRLTLTEPMLGTVAKDPAVYATYIESLKPQETEEDETVNVEKVEQKGWTGFLKDEEGLFIYDYMVKGFLKYAGNVLKDVLKVKALRSKITDYCFVFPRKIRFGLQEPDGVFERPLRGFTPSGFIVTLVKSDKINPGRSVDIIVKLIPHKELKWSIIHQLFDHGELSGLGQFRNGGFGRFTWEEIEVDARSSAVRYG